MYVCNVGCWLVARFAIVARKPGGQFALSKKCLCKRIWTFFSEKNAFLPVPKESDRLLNPYKIIKEQFFPQISKALGHERVQFTLVGLFSGFTIAANFPRADPGAKRRKERLLQKQLPNSKPKPFPKESDRLLNPY